MSIESSELIAALVESLGEQLKTLHNQHVNDISEIVNRLELRMITILDAHAKRITAIEQASKTK